MGEQTNIVSDPVTTFLKNLVETAGGEWCGVQESILPAPPLLMFTSRETGSTLAIPFNPMSFDGSELFNAVRARIAESNQKFADRKVPVKASVLCGISETLLKLQKEVTDLYARRESNV